MTLTTYAATVTNIVAAQTSPDFEFPDTFDADVAACFHLRLTPDQAADKLLAQAIRDNTARWIYCHGCGEQITSASAYWHNGDGYCDVCEAAPAEDE